MFKKLLNKKLVKNEKGLTLIELLAVIVILAIVSAIAIPAIGGIIENSRYKAVKADAINVINAAQLYYTDNPNATSPVTVQTLVTDKYLETNGSFDPVKTTASVSNANPKELSNATITYTTGKTVTFTGATIKEINDDPNKGSGNGGYTIGN